jgi:hypothetical protein
MEPLLCKGAYPEGGGGGGGGCAELRTIEYLTYEIGIMEGPRTRGQKPKRFIYSITVTRTLFI